MLVFLCWPCLRKNKINYYSRLRKKCKPVARHVVYHTTPFGSVITFFFVVVKISSEKWSFNLRTCFSFSFLWMNGVTDKKYFAVTEHVSGKIGTTSDLTKQVEEKPHTCTLYMLPQLPCDFHSRPRKPATTNYCRPRLSPPSSLLLLAVFAADEKPTPSRSKQESQEALSVLCCSSCEYYSSTRYILFDNEVRIPHREDADSRRCCRDYTFLSCGCKRRRGHQAAAAAAAGGPFSWQV